MKTLNKEDLSQVRIQVEDQVGDQVGDQMYEKIN